VKRGPLEVFVVSPPGFEDLVAGELRSLDLHGVAETPGGVRFTGGWHDVYRANLLSRVASRLLVRVARFRAETFRELEAGLRRVPWPEWLPWGKVLDIRVAKRRTRLYHTGKVAEVVSGVVKRGTGRGAQRLYLRIDGPEITVSLDSSGEHLHQRGYRTEPGAAPLRENLAAGLLLRAGWTGAESFLDPLCGSGTFPIEAALLALRAPPGGRRSFAFEEFPAFDSGAWGEVKSRAEEGVLSSLPHPVFASDADPEALALAARSARRAALADHLRVAIADLSDLEPPAETGLLVTNPPWGRRLGGERGAAAALQGALEGAFRGWRWGVVLPAGSPGRPSRLRPSAVFSFRSGGVGLRFVLGGSAPGAAAGDRQ
jgi:putative N6-adenine-specific DNA methylase